MIVLRRFLAVTHRWAGLTMTIFLVIVGLTGSLLAFYPELERLINPGFYPVSTSCAPLGPGELAERAQASIADGQVNGVLLEANQGATLVLAGPRPGGTPLSFDNLFIDPCTGNELARRRFGAIGDGIDNFMSFVYQLHYALAIGSLGIWILGICALLWTLDCLVSFYLTLPTWRKLPRSWWQRWMPAWQIRRGTNTYKLNFDLHRAGGLWLWIALLIFAWSSVALNLNDTVYSWVMRAASDYRQPWTELALRESPLRAPRIDWRSAQSTGERHMMEQSKLHGFTIERPIALRLDRSRGVYAYVVRSSGDVQDKRGRTSIYFDADTGELKLLLLPTGQFSGNTVTSWLIALHEANVFGLPYRIFVSVLGLVITMLSVTGVYIWWKKRRARTKQAARLSGQTS